jgi:hypothetical protein
MKSDVFFLKTMLIRLNGVGGGGGEQKKQSKSIMSKAFVATVTLEKHRRSWLGPTSRVSGELYYYDSERFWFFCFSGAIFALLSV